MQPFKSDTEMKEHFKKLADARKRDQQEVSLGSANMAVESAPTTVSSKPASPSDSKAANSKDTDDGITNTQTAGVDEGGIVKVHGNHLVILRRGRVLALGLLTPPGLLSLLIVPTLVFTSYICLNINHNQMHVQLFKGHAANTILNVVLSIATGVPVTTIYVPHLFNHHPNPNTSEDWMGGHVVGIAGGCGELFSIRSALKLDK